MGSDTVYTPFGSTIGTSEIDDNAITLAKLNGGTAGKYLGFDGSGDPAEKSSPGWVYVGETVISGSAAQEISFTSLDLDTDHVYLLIVNVENGHAVGSTNYDVFLNTDTTANHYYTQFVEYNGAGVAANRVNTSINIGFNAGYPWVGKFLIQKTVGDGTFIIGETAFLDPANVRLRHVTIAWTSTNNVTSVQVRADQADGLAVGSRAILLKYNG